MYKLMYKAALVSSLFLTSQLAMAASDPNVRYTDKIMYINSQLLDCDAGMMKMKCMQVKEKPKQKRWTTFYEQIDGFKYQAGYVYKISVRETKFANDPTIADRSNVKYDLIKVISKKPVGKKK